MPWPTHHYFPVLSPIPLFYPLFLRPPRYLSYKIMIRGNANLLLDIRPTVIFFPIDLSYRTPFVVFPMLSMRVNRPSIHCISPHRLFPHFSQMLDFSHYRFFCCYSNALSTPSHWCLDYPSHDTSNKYQLIQSLTLPLKYVLHSPFTVSFTASSSVRTSLS